jgi:hypothetical protein
MTGKLFTPTFAAAAVLGADDLVRTILLGPLGLASHLAVRARWTRLVVAVDPEPQRLG